MSNPDVILIVTNHLEKDFAFWLEPMGRRYVVRFGEQYEIVLDGVMRETTAIEPTAEGEIQIWCMGNVEVFHRGTPATPKWEKES